MDTITDMVMVMVMVMAATGMDTIMVTGTDITMGATITAMITIHPTMAIVVRLEVQVVWHAPALNRARKLLAKDMRQEIMEEEMARKAAIQMVLVKAGVRLQPQPVAEHPLMVQKAA